jgi:hypothetical protein
MWPVDGVTEKFVESLNFCVEEDSDNNSGVGMEGIELLGE